MRIDIIHLMRNFRRLFLLSCLWFFAFGANAQQLPLFTQYRDNHTIINPAMLSSDYLLYENNITIGASYRSQWRDLKNRPVTQNIHFDYLNSYGSGVALTAGGYLINDQTGPTGFTGVYGKIGGILTDDPYFGGLSFALNFGAVQYRINAAEIKLRDVGDQLPFENQAKIFPDVGLGVYYYLKLQGKGWFDDDYLYGGISAPQILGLDLEYSDLTGKVSLKRIQHIYANIGLYKFMRDDNFLEPSVWLRYAPNAPLSVDFNLRYQMINGFWIGAGASLSGNAHLELGFVIEEHMRIGYGFDYSFSSFGPSTGGSHEINLNYSFQK